ncbi:MAG TPA: hypothetical protein VGU63_07860 [Candidatus Acidoferrales bacterium]|nr:hypothetical protein [Candidatus Acidoferrales bacterium]
MATSIQGTRKRMNESNGRLSASSAKSAICEETVKLCTKAYGDRLGAIVLAGSLARNEGTFVQRDGHCALLGDADLFLVFRDNANMPPASEVACLGKSIEARLIEDGIKGTIGLDAVSPQYLQTLSPRILSYEVRKTGQVLWGNPDILSLIPAFSPAQIPREDAWRILCNRMVEQLDFVCEPALNSTRLSTSLQYAVTKLYLDLATSYLLFAGAYEPTYRAREKKLRELAGLPEQRPEPFSLKAFSARVSECTEQKLSGELDGNRGLVYWQEAISCAIQLWRWETLLLTSETNELSTVQLFQSMAGQLTYARKLRGWLSVARRAGWLESWRRWPRWARISFRTSPRYSVYQAAVLLTEQLCVRPDVSLSGTASTVNLQALNQLLPEPAALPSEYKATWADVAKAIVLNYQRFLIGTTA